MELTYIIARPELDCHIEIHPVVKKIPGATIKKIKQGNEFLAP